METGVHLFVEKEQSYFSSLLRCFNYKKGCLVHFKTKKELENHERTCKTVKEAQDNPTIIQTCYKYCEHPLEYAKKEGIYKFKNVYVFIYLMYIYYNI